MFTASGNSEELKTFGDNNGIDAGKLDDKDWGRTRKAMVNDQYLNRNQTINRPSSRHGELYHPAKPKAEPAPVKK